MKTITKTYNVYSYNELSDKAKEKVAELCKAAEKKANPNLDDESITGRYNNINDIYIVLFFC